MAFTRPFIGDTGTGGIEGLVPAPAAGDAAAGKFLKADGSWAVPAGGGGGGHVIQDNGVNKTARANLNFINFTVADNAGNDSTDITANAPVDSVNGQTGIVSLDTDDISEGTNLYFTDVRVRANRLDQMAAPTASVGMNSQKITSLGDPTASGDAANKGYVDALVQGLQVKPSAVVATTAALAAFTYNNGASGAGATITLNAVGVLTIDGVAVVLGDYVLIKDEVGANKPYNGLYSCTTEGTGGVAAILTRAIEQNTTTEFKGAFVFIQGGTVNASTGWVCVNVGNITVGTTDVSFIQFSGAGEIIAGVALTKSGNTLNFDLTELSEDTAPDSANDFIVTYDASASAHKKVKLTNIPKERRHMIFVLGYGLGGTMLTGDGQAALPIPADFNGWTVVGTPMAQVGTAGTTGTTDFQLRRVRSGAAVDVFSTKLTIDSGSITSVGATTPPVINASNDDLATGDWFYIDVDALSTTAPLGPVVVTVPIQQP